MPTTTSATITAGACASPTTSLNREPRRSAVSRVGDWIKYSGQHARWPCEECGRRTMLHAETEHSTRTLHGTSPRIATERHVEDDGTVVETTRHTTRPSQVEVSTSRTTYRCRRCGWTKTGEWQGVLPDGHWWSESRGIHP